MGPLGELLQQSPSCCVGGAASEPARELFEACRNGDVERVKRLVRPENVNGRDTAGRKSSPLHFAAGNEPCCPRAACLGLFPLGGAWLTLW